MQSLAELSLKSIINGKNIIRNIDLTNKILIRIINDEIKLSDYETALFLYRIIKETEFLIEDNDMTRKIEKIYNKLYDNNKYSLYIVLNEKLLVMQIKNIILDKVYFTKDTIINSLKYLKKIFPEYIYIDILLLLLKHYEDDSDTFTIEESVEHMVINFNKLRAEFLDTKFAISSYGEDIINHGSYIYYIVSKNNVNIFELFNKINKEEPNSILFDVSHKKTNKKLKIDKL